MQPRDLEVRDWIAAYILEHEGISPTYAEIAQGMHMTSRQVETSVGELAKAGKVTRRFNGRRSIQVPGIPTTPRGILGRMAALERRVAELEAMIMPEAAE